MMTGDLYVHTTDKSFNFYNVLLSLQRDNTMKISEPVIYSPTLKTHYIILLTTEIAIIPFQSQSTIL
jgi:hypothetical protein